MDPVLIALLYALWLAGFLMGWAAHGLMREDRQ